MLLFSGGSVWCLYESLLFLLLIDATSLINNLAAFNQTHNIGCGVPCISFMIAGVVSLNAINKHPLLAQGLSKIVCVACGMLTSTFGGVIRDVLCSVRSFVKSVGWRCVVEVQIPPCLIYPLFLGSTVSDIE